MKKPIKTAAKRSADNESAERGKKATPAFLKRERSEGEDTARYGRAGKSTAAFGGKKAAPFKSAKGR